MLLGYLVSPFLSDAIEPMEMYRIPSTCYNRPKQCQHECCYDSPTCNLASPGRVMGPIAVYGLVLIKVVA